MKFERQWDHWTTGRRNQPSFASEGACKEWRTFPVEERSVDNRLSLECSSCSLKSSEWEKWDLPTGRETPDSTAWRQIPRLPFHSIPVMWTAAPATKQTSYSVPQKTSCQGPMETNTQSSSCLGSKMLDITRSDFNESTDLHNKPAFLPVMTTAFSIVSLGLWASTEFQVGFKQLTLLVNWPSWRLTRSSVWGEGPLRPLQQGKADLGAETIS